MIILMKNVILAGVCIKDDAKVFQMKMDECIALCNACQLNVVETITQSANSMNTISAFRKGKLDELYSIDPRYLFQPCTQQTGKAAD